MWRKTSSARSDILSLAKPIFRRSDESAYTIIQSHISTTVSCQDSRISIESSEIIYRPLDFENELFTARVYKRNYRNSKTSYPSHCIDRGHEMLQSRLGRKEDISVQQTDRRETDCSLSVDDQSLIIISKINRDESNEKISFYSKPDPPCNSNGSENAPYTINKSTTSSRAAVSRNHQKLAISKTSKTEIETEDHTTRGSLMHRTKLHAYAGNLEFSPLGSHQRAVQHSQDYPAVEGSY